MHRPNKKSTLPSPPLSSRRPSASRSPASESAPAGVTPSSLRAPSLPQRNYPHVSLRDAGKHIVVEVEAPGVAAEDCTVSVERDVLVFGGQPKELVPGGYWEKVRERSRERFERRIKLFSDVDPNSARAQTRRGILTIVMAKREARNVTLIPIRSIG